MGKENTPMSPAHFAKKMAEVSSDAEIGHMEADKLMADLLESLGYKKGVAIFRAMRKWYA